ncbi:MAG: hypothetical protein SF187_04460 [Deltaproteobacteria bacterium]|nr:hypothetical protein [Deltaproteobacteria bacterium]
MSTRALADLAKQARAREQGRAPLSLAPLASAFAQRQLTARKQASPDATLALHERRLQQLQASHVALDGKVQALEQKLDEAMLAVVKGFGDLAGQLRRTRRSAQINAQKQTKRLASVERTMQTKRRADGRAQAKAAQVQKVNAVVSSMQVAAYGETGSLLSTNNLLLAGNQLLWSFVVPLLQQLGFPHIKPGGLLETLSPLGSLTTSKIFLGRRQHVRFVSGLATFSPGQSSVVVPLRSRIASAMWANFKARTDVPVAITGLDAAGEKSVRGVVRDGQLLIVLLGAPSTTSIRFAWMVDTGVASG